LWSEGCSGETKSWNFVTEKLEIQCKGRIKVDMNTDGKPKGKGGGTVS
jgi:hypothetical protein